jgi:hypothetical protein
MIIKVYTGELGAEEVIPNGDEVWSGGYGGHPDDKLPAAVLAVMIPELEIGRWYRIEEFQGLLQGAHMDGVPTTTVDIAEMGVNGRLVSTMEVGQALAARMLCESVIDHVRKIADTGDLWLRVE